MLQRLKTVVRRTIRSWQRGRQYPLALPHWAMLPEHFPASAQDDRALSLCDGQRTLAQAARAAGIGRSTFIELHERGLLVFWPTAVPEKAPILEHHPHAIIVSPHPDDAALSCGGRLLGDHSALIVNVFSRTAWWRFAMTPSDLPRIQRIRQAEEQLISRLCGEPIMSLDLPEALLRGHAMETVFTATPGAAEEEPSRALRAALADLAHQHPLAHWYLPLGIGNHIDHRLVRDLGAAALRESGVKPTHLHFYEDLPYAAKDGRVDRAGALPGMMLKQDLLDLDDRLAWKLELLRVYASQFRVTDLAPVRNYARLLGDGDPAEGVWDNAGSAR